MARQDLLAAIAVVIVVLAIIATVAFPNAPRVDGSSHQAMIESIEELMESLSPGEQQRLEASLMKLATMQVSGADRNRSHPGFRELLNGLTADEINDLTAVLESPSTPRR